MGVFKDLVFKLIPFKELRKKMNIDYDIEIQGDEFRVFLKYVLPRGWYLDVVRGLSKIYRKQIGMLDEWEVDERIKGMIAPRFASTLEKVVDEVRKDIPTFKIVKYEVKQMKFKQVGDKVETIVLIEGLCDA